MKQKSIKEPVYTRFPMMLIGVFIALYPVICFPVTLKLSEAELPFVPAHGGALTDLCVRSREIVLFAVGVCLILFWLGERIFPDHPRKSPLLDRKALLPLAGTGLILLCTVVSGIFSLHPELSFWGISSENTGIAAFIGFAALFLAAFEGGVSRENLRYITTGATVSGLLCGVMLLIEKLFGQLTDILWHTGESAGTMLLFGNSSACGEFCALLFPFLLACALSEQRNAAAAVHAVSAGAALCTALSSMSSTAFYGMLAEVAALAAFGIIRAAKNKKMPLKRLFIPLAAALPAAALLIFQPGILTAGAGNSVSYSPESSWQLTGAELTESTLRLTGKGELLIRIEQDGISLTDERSGETSLLTSSSDTAEISGITARLNGDILSLDLGYADKLRFARYDGGLGYVGLNGYIQPLEQSAFPELSEYYGMLTGRGYIWLNTLPVLRQCIFKGTGAGQLCFYFPQNDIVGALNTHGTANILTDKPHSMYLETALYCGIPALLILLAVTAVVLKRGAAAALGSGAMAGAFASVVGALIMGITNDISVVYIPLAVIFAGILSAHPNTRKHAD